MSNKQTVLVLGATGKQGGAVIKALDRSKYRIIGVTRDASSDKAKALSAENVQLVEASPDEPEAHFEEKVDAVFAVFVDPDPETQKRQSIALIDAAAKHGVKHLVYSGMDFSGQNPTGIPYFDAKHEVIRHLKAQAQAHSFKWTILGPVGFMENFFWPQYLDQVTTTWPHAKVPDQALIATEDIGKIAAEVIDRPDEFAGRELNIAGDSLLPEQIASIWHEVTGVTLQAKETPVFPEHLASAFQFFDDHASDANVEENRKLFPFLKDLKTWLEGTPFAKK